MMSLMLFGTSGCHLCEQAESIVNACVPGGVETVDIAEQEQWQAQFAIRIPVLYAPATKQELCWPFDRADVEIFISEYGRSEIA